MRTTSVPDFFTHICRPLAPPVEKAPVCFALFRASLWNCLRGAHPAVTFCSRYFELEAAFAKLASTVISLDWLRKKAEFFSKSPGRGGESRASWAYLERTVTGLRQSHHSGDMGFGKKTLLPVRNGEGCRPHAAGRSSYRFHLGCTDSACVSVGGGGCDLRQHRLLETN